MAGTGRILVIVTSAGEYEKVGFRTGLWLGELTHFYAVAEQAGFGVTIASIEGGHVPIDPESLAHDVLAEWGTDRRYADRDFMRLLDETRSVAEVEAADHDAIYLTGGHGVMFDFPDSQRLADLVRDFHESGKVVSAVCHGPCGLLNARLSSGEHLIRDRNVTGFSWREEELARRDKAVPYSLEDGLRERGARYRATDQPFASHVVEDDRLITGQNPASARAVAEAVVRKLR
ncbi:putative intracellular protease/amidase [Streptoalloteichus tenebrarius]|uniref:Intracellular protease/amidase n=1 Tax=Streptoalloteichus tenebrarius (strain ATCC 17920 / DSM 40477 / JCM 4838 / CBS 697.72 / NBRC 16177 / NCIMB 11028 / NRRL B-12390 / A12253. 1 / ISP 5477) TaxID=1933 RepID=A0ABT1HM17_STRSD|nr:type 1 glutamine amidotransferase domain-containing protein [Streptoalloteichus tenebrarius]MCP2256548.1 putative intracellular protease/amidase [Streptoalloteichus tenebrarius]BFF04903.1 type 1 glutamine amidotransferase domain-containing protein [Streptoalloteichus tenebrarius]